MPPKAAGNQRTPPNGGGGIYTQSIGHFAETAVLPLKTAAAKGVPAKSELAQSVKHLAPIFTFL